MIALIIVIFILFGCIWQSEMQSYELGRDKPVGDIYSINGHDMHIYRAGKGKNTIVFITGSGTPCAYTDFYDLQKEFSQYAYTVSYDHAGFGWSDATNQPRDIDTLVSELHELLQASSAPTPYLLTAHSLGSLEALHYAQVYPDEVKGIILLDGGSPEYYKESSEATSILLNRFCALLRVSGINRLLNDLGIYTPFVGNNDRSPQLPKKIAKLDRIMYYRLLGNSKNLANIKMMNENAQTVLKGGRLTNISLLILSSDSTGNWLKVQNELIFWSNISKQETIKNATHYIHWSEEDTVLSEIVDYFDIAKE